MRLVFCALLIVCFFFLASGKNIVTEDEVVEQFFKYAKKAQSDEDKQLFKKMVDVLAFPRHVQRAQVSSRFEERNVAECLGCRAVVKNIIEMRKKGATDQELIEAGVAFCIVLNIASKEVCRGSIELNVPIITYIIDKVPAFSEKALCGLLLQNENKKSCQFTDSRFQWEIDIPAKKSDSRKVSNAKSTEQSKLKVLHLTDIHYDPKYEPNGVANCDAPCCCRKGQKERVRGVRYLSDDYESPPYEIYMEDDVFYMDLDKDPSKTVQKRESREVRKDNSKAGYWGDYRLCDLPWWTFTEAIDRIKETHKDIDYIYYTGDTVDHGVWETTKELLLTSINETTDYIKAAFGDIPVYPVLGNHEGQPVNEFTSSAISDGNLSSQWIYDFVAEKWSVWLPESTKKTIKAGGYYTVLVKPGFRIVALNNNICYVFNWWIHYDPYDPNGQLNWLVEVLTAAEKNNEKVHILAHIPAGSKDCYFTYNREYRKIVERFSDIIMAEFNGHTHNDEFKVFYNKNQEPYLVGWNGGSLTPYANLNPNYKLFEVDNTTLDVINQDTYVYNLTEANLTPDKRPRWYLEYNFQEFYKIPSLQPKYVGNLLERMVTTEKDLLQKFYHYLRGKYADPFMNKTCTEKCIQKNLYYMSVSELYDDTVYKKLVASWNNEN